jgi:6-pyruvoyltetrahydropterin/6-carboxytetrahydropterin synthase
MAHPTYLTRAARFSAAHRYYREEWSEETNRARFGACSNPHGHGHNYVLEATFAGEPDPSTGFSVDLGLVDAILREGVVEWLDHQHLNHRVPEFAVGGLVPTTENLVILIWERLAPRLGDGAKLVRLRLREDVDLFVDYYGPSGWPAAGAGE